MPSPQPHEFRTVAKAAINLARDYGLFDHLKGRLRNDALVAHVADTIARGIEPLLQRYGKLAAKLALAEVEQIRGTERTHKEAGT